MICCQSFMRFYQSLWDSIKVYEILTKFYEILSKFYEIFIKVLWDSIIFVLENDAQKLNESNLLEVGINIFTAQNLVSSHEVV